jgi:hypothetical protein
MEYEKLDKYREKKWTDWMVVETNGGGQSETRLPIGIPNLQLDEAVICRKHIIHLQVFVSPANLRTSES